jgi:hypothetical protein
MNDSGRANAIPPQLQSLPIAPPRGARRASPPTLVLMQEWSAVDALEFLLSSEVCH